MSLDSPSRQAETHSPLARRSLAPNRRDFLRLAKSFVSRPARSDSTTAPSASASTAVNAVAELFATKGLSVGLDEIAHHAARRGRSAYRRFPDERQLIEELLDERVSRIVQLAEHALAARDTRDGLPGSSNRRPNCRSPAAASKRLTSAAITAPRSLTARVPA